MYEANHDEYAVYDRGVESNKWQKILQECTLLTKINENQSSPFPTDNEHSSNAFLSLSLSRFLFIL